MEPKLQNNQLFRWTLVFRPHTFDRGCSIRMLNAKHMYALKTETECFKIWFYFKLTANAKIWENSKHFVKISSRAFLFSKRENHIYSYMF